MNHSQEASQVSTTAVVEPKPVPASKQDYWEPIIHAWRESGISQSAYCRNNDLKLSNFIYWRAKTLGKAIASTALLAYLIIGKYCDGSPLYRQEGILKRFGAYITRTTLANWLIRLSLELQPLLNLLQETQLQAKYLQGDETRMQVLKEPGMEPTGDKRIWVMRGGPPEKPVVLFNYDKSRGKAVVKRLLKYFEGDYFQSDGYAGYDQVCIGKDITHLGCWDHARRKFVEAEKAQPKQKHKNTAPSKATMALSLINKLYRIEREIKALDSDEKYEQRQKCSVPALNKLKQWLDTNQTKIAKDSLTRKAVDYTLNQWPKMIRLL